VNHLINSINANKSVTDRQSIYAGSYGGYHAQSEFFSAAPEPATKDWLLIESKG
jgi:hypothetical protein